VVADDQDDSHHPHCQQRDRIEATGQPLQAIAGAVI
jgi:hypothetical protein